MKVRSKSNITTVRGDELVVDFVKDQVYKAKEDRGFYVVMSETGIECLFAVGWFRTQFDVVED